MRSARGTAYRKLGIIAVIAMSGIGGSAVVPSQRGDPAEPGRPEWVASLEASAANPTTTDKIKRIPWQESSSAVAAVPDCAAAERVPAGCAIGGTQLPARNDRATGTLTVDLADLGAMAADDSAATFAVTSAVGGDTGTFAASQLSLAGSWQVAPGSGEFSYAYPIGVPAPGVGSAPSVGLSYSSGAVDGLTRGSTGR